MFSTMRSAKAEIVMKGLTSSADRMIDPSAVARARKVKSRNEEVGNLSGK